MPLSAGDKLGPYEILAPIGAGGMGEVYRARDTTLKRDVALKVLPATFLRDGYRMARFQREAEVLASLDHPNIRHKRGIVDSEDSRGLVLALIEGPTLADRIQAGQLPLKEVQSDEEVRTKRISGGRAVRAAPSSVERRRQWDSEAPEWRAEPKRARSSPG